MELNLTFTAGLHPYLIVFLFFQASGLQSSANLIHLPDSAKNWGSYFVFTSGENSVAGGGKWLPESITKKRKRRSKNSCFTSIHMIRRCLKRFFSLGHLNFKPINQKFRELLPTARVQSEHPPSFFYILIGRPVALLTKKIPATWLHDVVDEAMLPKHTHTKKAGSRTQERTVKSCGRMIVRRRALVAAAQGFRCSVETILCHVFTWNTYYLHMYGMKKNIRVRPEGPPNNL